MKAKFKELFLLINLIFCHGNSNWCFTNLLWLLLNEKMFYFKNGQINVFFNYSLIWSFFMIRFDIFQHCAHFAILPSYNFTEFRNSLVNFSSPLTDWKIDFIIWPKNSNVLFLAKISKNPKLLLMDLLSIS